MVGFVELDPESVFFLIMDPKLLWVADSGNIDALYSLIHKDPYILEKTDVLPFVHTPLREASSTGKIDLAMELMVLKPSFAKKLNTSGLSPLHLAVENHQVQLALELVKFNPDLVRVAGRKGICSCYFWSVFHSNVHCLRFMCVSVRNCK